MKETEQRCKAGVRSRGSNFFRTHQCRRMSVKDGYCTIHHPDRQELREKRSEQRAILERQARARHYLEIGIGARVLEIVEKAFGHKVDPFKAHPITVLDRYAQSLKRRQ